MCVQSMQTSLICPPDPLWPFGHSVLCSGRLTSMDSLPCLWSWVWLRGNVGRMQEEGGTEETEIRVFVPRAFPGRALHAGCVLWSSLFLSRWPPPPLFLLSGFEEWLLSSLWTQCLGNITPYLSSGSCTSCGSSTSISAVDNPLKISLFQPPS